MSNLGSELGRGGLINIYDQIPSLHFVFRLRVINVKKVSDLLVYNPIKLCKCEVNSRVHNVDANDQERIREERRMTLD